MIFMRTAVGKMSASVGTYQHFLMSRQETRYSIILILLQGKSLVVFVKDI